MRAFVSGMVLAASFALLVPDNQTLRAAESFRALPAAVHSVIAQPAASSTDDETPAAPASNATWLLALGFLAAVISRRLGAE
jgi:MYXO-CTERM domain-containing protein